jgi:hypothetical protein
MLRQPGPLLLGPDDGDVVLEPEHAGSGYWVGAPSVLIAPDAGCCWLTYRRRRPRGVNPDGRGERGYVARVARSTDGLRFEDVWEVDQRAWSTPSMERFSLVRAGDIYRLYVSYVDPADNRWRIDLLEAEDPSRFDSGALQPVLTSDIVPSPAGEGIEGVKDPWVFRAGDTWQMLVSYAISDSDSAVNPRLHASADAFNTGLVTAPTALASSTDGRCWEWHGRILDTGPAGAWDRYQARLSSLVPMPGFWLGFYDGAASHHENYEERCGLATSADLRHWTKLTPHQPAVLATQGTGSIRYVDTVYEGGALHCYYECARPDGAHELRCLQLPRSGALYSSFPDPSSEPAR